ncbi:ABC transporter, permease protein, putative [Synechococcus sp. PCC 7335]|uniref:ABC transporter permease n=1 Tax=Synechococcus sp. (strain ATCC 29403 / PCC 7335) TaxID=91464 RepID=UPI00017ED8DC|nr:ABC transporter permease [Synechococcus sp. PCC 7335]EDX84362.1 ABC transporter, permease protein, putative [Synechococcus sp. PCC 7335]
MARSSTAALIARRTFAAIPSVLGVIVLTFILTRALPGDPAAYFAGPAASQEAIEQVRETLGLNRSLPEQFFIYLGELARGDLGSSLTTGQTVLSDLLTRLPASLELTLAGLFFSLTLAIPLGILAATRPGSWIDHGVRVLATAGVSLPTFFTGLLLIYVFYFLFGIAPAPLGRLDILYSPPRSITGLYLIDSLLSGNLEIFWAALSQLFLPAVTLGLFALAPLARVTRAAMLAVLSSDFIRTARASGLSTRTVLFGYAFRNALLPIVTTLGVVFSFLLGANVLVEKVFSWPGIGSYAVSALVASDYAAVQGFVLTMALLYVVLNLLIDLLYVVIDPRAGVES